MTDIIVDAIVDSLKLFPFLFLIYAVIEVLEHNTAIGKKGGVLPGESGASSGRLDGYRSPMRVFGDVRQTV